MGDFAGQQIGLTYQKVLHEESDGTIHKGDGTEGVSSKANLSGGNTFSGVQDFDNGFTVGGGADVLDAYDEGTWTLNLEGRTTAGTLTTTTNQNDYRVVGDEVSAWFDVKVDSVSVAPDGLLQIDLPFQAKAVVAGSCFILGHPIQASAIQVEPQSETSLNGNKLLFPIQRDDTVGTDWIDIDGIDSFFQLRGFINYIKK